MELVLRLPAAGKDIRRPLVMFLIILFIGTDLQFRTTVTMTTVVTPLSGLVMVVLLQATPTGPRIDLRRLLSAPRNRGSGWWRRLCSLCERQGHHVVARNEEADTSLR